MNEIVFNGKGNFTDFDTILNYFMPQAPTPKIIKDSVPFINGSYNFSTVATNGEMVFGERKIPCSIEFDSNNKALLMIKYSQLLEWLLSGTHDLIYTGEPDMKYIASVDDVPSFDNFYSFDGKLEFAFTAYPFKQGINLVGQETWDTFNFETDIDQDTEFDVIGSLTINLYNPGRAISPTVNCNSSMVVTNNGYTANFVNGDNNDWLFKLQPGMNNITITGTGHIKFIFRKEML